MTLAIAVLIGFSAGVVIGAFVMACAVVAGRSDEDAERNADAWAQQRRERRRVG
jgi:hypothetical protein